MVHRLKWLNLFLFLMVIIPLGIAAALASGGLERDFVSGSDEALISGKLTHGFETHYDKRFPAKTLGTNVWAALDYQLFHEGREGVVVGRDGWLFTLEEFQSPKLVPGTSALNLKRVASIVHFLQHRKIPLVVLVIPSKERVYNEYQSGKQPLPVMQAAYRNLHDELTRLQVPAPDLLQPMQSAARTQQIYLRTDTHWTPQGADLAAQVAAKAIRQHFTGMHWGKTEFVTHTEAAKAYRGDLLNYIPVAPYLKAFGPAPDQLRVRVTQEAGAGGDSQSALFGDQRTNVVLSGTSYSAIKRWDFAGALRQHLGHDLINVSKKGEGPFVPLVNYLTSDDFRSNPPRLLVWEFPERYLAQPVTNKAVLAFTGTDGKQSSLQAAASTH